MYSNTNNRNHVPQPSFSEREAPIAVKDHKLASSKVAQHLLIPEWDPYLYRTQYFPTSSDRSTVDPVVSTTSTTTEPRNTNTQPTPDATTLMQPRTWLGAPVFHGPTPDEVEALRRRVDQVTLDEGQTTRRMVQDQQYLSYAFKRSCNVTDIRRRASGLEAGKKRESERTNRRRDYISSQVPPTTQGREHNGYEVQNQDERSFDVPFEVLAQPSYTVKTLSMKETSKQVPSLVSVPEHNSSATEDENMDDDVEFMEEDDTETIHAMELTMYEVASATKKYTERKRRYGHGW